MPSVRCLRIASLALLVPLLLGACRDKTEESAPVSEATPQATPAAASVAPAKAAPAAPAATTAPAPTAAKTTPAPPPVCMDCGTITDVRSYEVKGQASGVGAAVGAVAGGLLGNQIGGGSGKKIATVAGAVGGGLAGHEIEKRRNTETRWEVTVQMDNGTTATLPYTQAPGLGVGQKVRVVNGQAVPL
jgi:outer membrane lipoprotein SlyB